MSITRELFESGNFVRKYTNVQEHPIVVLLKKNSSKAFRVDEIVHTTKKEQSTVRSFLRTLIRKGLVEHKIPYFMWKLQSTKKKISKKAKRSTKKTAKRKRR